VKQNLAEQEAERVAEDLVTELGISALPVCPFSIAKSRDIIVQPRDSDKPGVSGCLMRVGDQFGILYSSHIENEGFIRFTVAHELGHYFIPGHCDLIFQNGVALHESRGGYMSHDPCERQADTFASTLLMPESLFLPALREVGVGFKAISSLSTICKTSITSTAIRYARYAEDPVAIVVSSGNAIDYCFTSDALEAIHGFRRISKGSSLPPRSLTAEFNRNEANIAGGIEKGGFTPLDNWFDGVADGIEMKEDVVGLGAYGKTLTVLFTDDILPDPDDLDEDD
jgi:IrrE N-terminal-like domain